ncbi:MAG: DUF5041 domain-containing protein [Prevotella sp.]|nr:DUF5041 domain-containing protein [Prevotella sp.]
MKTIITFIMALALGISCHAQNYEVKPQKANVDDYIQLLNLAQYEVFSFDISSLCDSTRIFEFVLRECECGKVKSERTHMGIFRPNRIMLSKLSEETRQEVIAEGEAYDVEKGIYTVSKKITVNFTPIKNDSLGTAYIDMENAVSMPVFMKLRPVFDPNANKTTYMHYVTRPYNISAFEYDKFIPLVMYGSFWYDEQFNGFRFCGDNELTPDKLSDIEQLSPHYYVIGIKIHKSN